MTQNRTAQRSFETSAKGEVMTFFSYKGGTGRTMALANIAVLLAREVKYPEKVLIIDWDLEAPGLDRYFMGDTLRNTDEKASSSKTPGLIELFKKLNVLTKKKPPQTDADYAVIIEEASIDKYVLPVPGHDRLYLMKAGCFNDKYAHNVNSFRWDLLYSRCPNIFSSLSEYLSNRYRYVLIDSRTGLTDTSSICASLMPEKLVLVFTPNQQSLAGIGDLVLKATEVRRESHDLRPLLAYPLPSRIDLTHKEKERTAWRKGDFSNNIRGYQPLFEQLFKKIYNLSSCDMESYFTEVQIQHVPELAYGEKIAVTFGAEEDRFSIKRSYEAFLGWLANGYFPWESREEAEFRREISNLERELKDKFPEEQKVAQLFCTAERLAAAKLRSRDHFNLKSMWERVSNILTRVLGDDHPQTLKSIRHLALALQELGELSRARALQEKVYATRKIISREEDAEIFTSMTDLGRILRDQGDFAAARILLEQAIYIRRKALSEDDPESIACRSLLAMTLKDMGLYAEARALQERTLDLAQKVLGTEHSITLEARVELASILLAEGDLAGAQRLHEWILDVSRRLFGEEHLNTIVAINSLGEVLRAQNDLFGAMQLQTKAHELFKRVLGDDHPDTIMNMFSLARTLRDLGDLTLARRLQEKGIDILTQMYGRQHPKVGMCLHNLALTLARQKNLEGAKLLQEEALDIFRFHLGQDHPHTIATMASLAQTLKVGGHVGDALALYRMVLDHYVRLLGLQHPNTTSAAFNLAKIYLELKDHKNSFATISQYLTWLKAADATALTASQRKIRNELIHYGIVNKAEKSG